MSHKFNIRIGGTTYESSIEMDGYKTLKAGQDVEHVSRSGRHLDQRVREHVAPRFDAHLAQRDHVNGNISKFRLVDEARDVMSQTVQFCFRCHFFTVQTYLTAQRKTVAAHQGNLVRNEHDEEGDR